MTVKASFSVGEVAALVGMSPHTIRAWERRHRVVKPRRSASGHRRYSRDDVELLTQVKQLSRARGYSIKLALLDAKGMMVAGSPSGPISRADVAESRPAVDDDMVPWRAVADLLPFLVIILDPKGHIVDANIPVARAAARLRRELRGVRLVDLVEPHDRAKAARIYRAPLQQRRGWELNLRVAALSGLYAFDCWPIRQGDRWFVACVGRDLRHAGLEFWPPD